jgi:hypothetical protein
LIAENGSARTAAWHGFSAFSAKLNKVKKAVGNVADKPAIGKLAWPKQRPSGSGYPKPGNYGEDTV